MACDRQPDFTFSKDGEGGLDGGAQSLTFAGQAGTVFCSVIMQKWDFCKQSITLLFNNVPVEVSVNICKG